MRRPIYLRQTIGVYLLHGDGATFGLWGICRIGRDGTVFLGHNIYCILFTLLVLAGWVRSEFWNERQTNVCV